MYKLVILCISLLIVVSSVAKAEDNIQTLYARVCEPIKEDESKSSARVRATDKACFKAIENISALSVYRDQYDAHDFNVLVYSLVDNHLEDLAARTVSQNNTEVCVEITGYLNILNIEQAIKYIAYKQEDSYPKSLEIEADSIVPPSPNAIPQKPNIKINQEIAVETALEDERKTAQTSPLKDNDKTKVFIERTEFFDNTTTNAFYADIESLFDDENKNVVTKHLSDANYILKTKVLRAKVDPLNDKTNRLQMVVAIELLNTSDNSSIIEHQNRFILFENGEDEQAVAAPLLKKMLRKAIKQIVPKIKSFVPKKGSVITPTSAVRNKS